MGAHIRFWHVTKRSSKMSSPITGWGRLYGTLLLLQDSRNPVILAYGRPNTLLARTQSRSDLPPGSQLGGGLYGTVLLFDLGFGSRQLGPGDWRGAG
jgi:hypothetical protein